MPPSAREDIGPTEKLCANCRELRPLSDFWRAAGTIDGLQYSCKDCQKSRKRTPKAVVARNAWHARTKLTPTGIARALRQQARTHGYDLSVEERDQRLDEQGHRCGVCLRPFRKPKWHLACLFVDEKALRGRRLRTVYVDHDHKTGLVRGLLCINCNRTLVKGADDHPEWLRAALSYVEQGGYRRVDDILRGE